MCSMVWLEIFKGGGNYTLLYFFIPAVSSSIFRCLSRIYLDQGGWGS